MDLNLLMIMKKAYIIKTLIKKHGLAEKRKADHSYNIAEKLYKRFELERKNCFNGNFMI